MRFARRWHGACEPSLRRWPCHPPRGRPQPAPGPRHRPGRIRMTTLIEAAPATASIQVSAAAAGKIAELIADEGDPALALRVYVTGGGCSGMQYGFSFENSAAEDDLRIERSGIALLIDPMSLQYLNGADIDFEDGLEGSRFVIRNPNATTTCGCGSSFSV